jgi:hypothetical protein
MLQNEEVRAVGIEVNHDPDEDGYEEYVEDRDVIRWRTTIEMSRMKTCNHRKVWTRVHLASANRC